MFIFSWNCGLTFGWHENSISYWLYKPEVSSEGSVLFLFLPPRHNWGVREVKLGQKQGCGSWQV